MAKLLSEMRESEFLDFIKGLSRANYPSEQDHINSILEFEKISEHPSGSDLLFYPEPGKEGPEAVVAEIKAWRAANGKPGFKLE